MNLAIELKKLNKTYGDTEETRVQALKNVDLKVIKGEFLAIIGPSGCGKSTLLNMVGILDRPTSGKILIDGEDTSKFNDAKIAKIRGDKIGFIFQFFNLFPTLKALENIELPMTILGVDKEKRREKALELLRLVDLEKFAHHFPRQLSGGQQQRLAIARSLANDPILILADEPTGNLDTKTSHDIMRIFSELNEKKGITIIMITHEPDIAEHAAELIHMQDGKIIKRVKNPKILIK